MDPEKQREIARKGGKAAHAKGTAHEFSSEEARLAGKKGGASVSRNRGHMSTIGREGGTKERANEQEDYASERTASTNSFGSDGVAPAQEQT